MATKLYFRKGVVGATGGLGTSQADPAGVLAQSVLSLSTVPGAAKTTITTTSVTGATSGIGLGVSGVPSYFVSSPVAAAITISGTITLNIWGLEAASKDNAGFQVIIKKIDAQGNVGATILNSERGTEMGTSAAVNNWTATPTSTAMAVGERLLIMICANDAGGTMVSGGTITADIDGPTTGSDGDSYVQFTETVTFTTSSPFNTTLQLLTTPSSIIQNSGMLYATNWTETAHAGGSFPWTTPDNVLGRPDGVYASIDALIASPDSLSGQSYGGVAGVVIPVGATVCGIQVEITAYSDASLGGDGISVKLCKFNAGNTVEVGSAKTQTLTSVPTKYTFGSNTDLWGTTWSLAEVAAFSFGAGVLPTGSNVGNIFIDSIGIMVYYSFSNSISPLSLSSIAGSLNTSAITNRVTGYTNPVQITDTAGGNALEWFSEPLNAFTLSGVVEFQVNAQASSATGDNTIAVRGEVAICNEDGSSPVVWGAFNQDSSGDVTLFTASFNSTAAAPLIYVAGPDTAILQGQRLRIRIYIDDAVSAMNNTGTITVIYNGPGGANQSTINIPESATFATPSLSVAGRRNSRRYLLR